MKIVLDTNVLVVAISRRSKYYPIWQALRDGKFDLLVTTDILNEYEEIIGKNLSPELATVVLETLDSLPNVEYVFKYYAMNLIYFDADDNKFTDCAFARNADFLVTNDKHFNVLHALPFPKINLLNADEFLKML